MQQASQAGLSSPQNAGAPLVMSLLLGFALALLACFGSFHDL
jgi:hypothetical protein